MKKNLQPHLVIFNASPNFLVRSIVMICALSLLFSCKKGQNRAINDPDTLVVRSDIAKSIDIETGVEIFHSDYIDQPYILKLSNGAWICFYTKSPANESSAGETVGISMSYNKGQSWQAKGDLEPATGPAAFYAVPFLNSNGRIYVIYGYDIDDLTHGFSPRLTGKMCYKYSDNNGETWSARNTIDIPVTQIDLVNVYHDKGKHQQWWTIDKPILSTDGQMFLAFTKNNGNLDTHEGFILSSPNINTETDNSKVIWNFTPKGDHGIVSPFLGNVQEEFNVQQLSNGSFVSLNRTAQGYPGICYSYDNCQTWTTPVPALYAYGDTIRNPRACARIFKCSNGKFLLWYHNDSFTSGHRNPVWLSGGIEDPNTGLIKWSQPEILMFSQIIETYLLISYPDLIEDDGNYYITETQKKTARIHKINPRLLDLLWAQGTTSTPANDYLATDFSRDAGANSEKTIALDSKAQWDGVTLELKLSDQMAVGTLITCRADNNDGILKVEARAGGDIGVDLYKNGNLIVSYNCDKKLIKRGENIISFMLDNQAHVLSSMVNGILCNGDYQSKQGWVRIPTAFVFKPLNQLSLTANNSVSRLRIFTAGMRTSDMISEYNFLNKQN
ncbi:sialidase family protein [Mucilaginibacter sp. Mucisp86]|uniref:sialidase family protein n=1 Tax=Mucilaginibacter sp. Mucisp86 TaxID=3243060 RepID=UPI0039B51943